MIGRNQTSCTPREELYQRIERFQKHLRTADIQAALVVQKADLFYFSGTCQDANLLIPAQGEPLLMVRKSFERALEDSALDKIVAVRGFKDIRDGIAKIIKGKGRIGLELDVLPANLFFRYQEMLEPLEIIDASGAIREIRTIKTPYEIGCLKESARVTYEMFNEIPNLIKEGMTEKELSGRLELFMRSKGNRGLPRGGTQPTPVFSMDPQAASALALLSHKVPVLKQSVGMNPFWLILLLLSTVTWSTIQGYFLSVRYPTN